MPSNRIRVHDKTFEISISEAEIQKEVTRLADEINRDLADKDPVFLGILNGAFMFLFNQMLQSITVQGHQCGFRTGKKCGEYKQSSKYAEKNLKRYIVQG